MSPTASPPALLRSLFDAAVRASQAATCLPPHLPPPPRGRTVVIGAGKASAAMAQALEAHWPGPLEGLVLTRYGHGVPCRRIEIVEAAHPVPDAAGLQATARLLAKVQGLGPDDLVIALWSGGGSSLLVAPGPGLTLTDKQAVHTALLRSGASISEMNCVRRHLSAVKGGRLALACAPAPIVTLLISDVPGDAPADIASGPTVADATTCADALAIAARYRVSLPLAAQALLQSEAGETVKPGDTRLQGHTVRLIATPQQALEAAAAAARAAGVPAYILGDSLEGEARHLGQVLAGIALQVARHGQPFLRPCVLLSGGEASVTVTGDGVGGRNVETLLSMALALRGQPGIHALAADTDGVDGGAEIAGACIGPDTLARALALGLQPRAMLTRQDAHGFFQALGDSLVTGPTFTNVNDFRAVLVL